MTRLRGLAALAALAVATVGVPWALVRFGNWPIHGLPTTAQLRDLGDAVVSDTAVFAVLTVAAWAVWATLMASVTVEAFAVARGIQAPRLSFAGPVQRSARALVAAVVLALTIQHAPRSAGALPPTTPTQARAQLVADMRDPAVPAPAARDALTPGEPERAVPSAAAVTVSRGDSAWSIAETHLGDGMRWRELWDLNRGVAQPDGRAWTDPQIIRPGWQLRLPDAADTPQVAATDASHTVVAGDTLTGIARTHLGDPSRYIEIFELNRDVEQPDGQRLTDPDLIRPGWTLQLPQTAGTAEPQPTPAPSGPPPSAPLDPGTPTSTTVPPTAAPPPTTQPTTPTAPATPPADSATAAPNATRSEAGDTGPSGPINPALAGLAGAVVLASGLAARIAFLRRRRATRGAHAARLPAAPDRVLDAVVAAADTALVRWAGQHLARLVAGLDRRTVTGAPLAVEFSETAGIEVLWDSPQPGAPPPWTVADGGWAWRLAFDPDAPVPADELPAAIPALVTVGQREGRQLMVDLEAFGTVTVSGDAAPVETLLRSVAVELAAGQDLADASVLTVGLDAGVQRLDRLVPSPSIDDAIAHLDGARRSVSAALDAARIDGTFAARAGSSAPLDVTVVVGRPATSDNVARLVHAAPPRRGVAALLSTDTADTGAGAHIELRPDGTARLEPLGVDFTPVALPAPTATQLDELLEALEHTEGLDSPSAPRPSLDIPPSGGPRSNGHRPLPADEDQPADQADDGATNEGEPCLFPPDEPGAGDNDAEPAMLVRVLGAPTIPDRPDLGRRELILTTLLACRGAPVAASAAQDALWGGKPVEPKTVWNVIGATRRALGDLPDGTPVMPPADRDKGTLRVSPGITTDLALLAGLVSRAETAPSSEAIGLLRDGLELVTGPPFDAAGYDWAHRDQDVAHASALIERAAQTLVDLALDAGLVDVARDAVTRGVRGLPGNEQLYRCRMRVEHHAGNLAGVSAAHDELVAYLADLETEPSPATTALYQDLVRPVPR